ncbi:protein FAM98A-like [Acipenser oxyrinchus oxyrinchus]|uniref:Protein FAM98A-like n=1 Tax=Acipenser oxyrinchus oxyrinchus TaxID=40147 RepID=A0AAD8GAU7_ACIOX|nr:protein FAM98A-like [Acipenser oxyrinchus oxyrinchus]
MENDVLDCLEDLCYKGPLVGNGALDRAVAEGAASPEFTKLCAWIVSEIKLYCKLEENVQATNSPSEAEGFQFEMSGLLAEMNCPYSVLTTGDVSKRLLNKNTCLLLLTYLISELEALKMVHVSHPPKTAPEGGGSDVFLELKGICVGLGMSKPPANIAMFQFFSGIEKKLKEAMSKAPPNHVGKPLLKKPLGPVHWEKIEAVNQALVNEYEVRRKMLLKRLDVTVQSFGWSERAKARADQLAKVYPAKRTALATKSSVSIAHLYAAREDLSKILRTSSGRIREKSACAINKVLMGRVPDRGGRPNEIEPPPPEMPPWQKGRTGRSSMEGEAGSRTEAVAEGLRSAVPGRAGGYDRGGGGGVAEGAKYKGVGGMEEVVATKATTKRADTKVGRWGVFRWRVSRRVSATCLPGKWIPGRRRRRGHQGGGGVEDTSRITATRTVATKRGGRGAWWQGQGNRGGQGGGWGGRGGQNLNQGGQFEQYFQQGGYHYNQAGFGQGKHYSS